MHVAFICNEYPPGVHGGVGSLTRTIARGLVASGHRATVIGTYRRTGDTVEDDAGVRVIRLGSRGVVPGARAVVDQRRLWARLAREHGAAAIDVVEGPEPSFWAAPGRLPFPTMVRMNGGHRFFAEAEGRSPALVRRSVEARSIARVDDLVAVSSYVGERTRALLGLGTRPIAVIPNPVDTEAFRPGPVPVEPGTVLFLGTVCEKKGVRQLVEAFPAIAAQVPAARLQVAGRDQVDPATGRSFSDRLRATVPPGLVDRVQFLGPVDHDRIAALIAAAEVCVLPSHMEALPVAWLEVLASGKALVASRTGPGPEVVVDGESGVLCDPFDPGSIADATVRVLTDPSRRAHLERGARERAEACFGIDRLADVNLQHYAAVVSRFAAGTLDDDHRDPADDHPGADDRSDERVCDELTVLSHVVHHRWQGEVHAYTPYAQELGMWAGITGGLRIVAPVRDDEPPSDTSVIEGPRIRLVGLPQLGGDRPADKLRQALALPGLTVRVARALRGADAVQVRVPGNIGLVGVVLAPALNRRVMAKYAGQWGDYPIEPRTWRAGRAVLRSRWFRGPVLAYGPAPTDRPHVVPAFSTALDERQLARAASAASGRRPHEPLRVLFVGRLSAPKHADAVIRAVARLRDDAVAAELQVVGDGHERDRLSALARDLGVEGAVRFAGALDADGVLDAYRWADVLALVSETEGWPKAIVEAMAFGVVCVGSDRGLVPRILGDGRGFVVEPGDAPGLATVLGHLAGDEPAWLAASRASAAFARPFSLERYRAEVVGVLGRAWAGGSDVLRPPDLRSLRSAADPLTPREPDRATVQPVTSAAQPVPTTAQPVISGEGIGSPPVTGPAEGGPRSVAQVIDSLDAGGAERMAVNLAGLLAASGADGAGIDSHLIVTRTGGALESAIGSGVRTSWLGRRSTFDWRAARALRAYVADQRIEVLHVHSTSIFVVAAAFPIGRRPAIVWHDHFPGVAHRRAGPYRAVARWMDAVVAVSHEIADWDRAHLGVGNRLTQLDNFPVLEAPVDRADLPGRPGSRLVCLANLRPAKDQVGLVRAMRRIVDQWPDAHLVLVGAPTDPVFAAAVDGEIRRQGLGASVTVLGPRSDVAAVLAGCDLGILGSTEEGWPLALLEYGLAGLPVVATAVGDVPELLDGGRAGVLVPPGDPDALADAVLGLLRDPPRATELAVRLHERVAAGAAPREQRRRWAEVYRRAQSRHA